MNEKHIKDAKLITSIFNTFEKGSAIIAGGYPRDLQLGREPKDIDILVEWESQLDYDELYILADRLGYLVRDYSDQYADETDGQLRRVLSLVPKTSSVGFDETVVIDVIFLNCKVFERIYNFPCTLSEAWLEGDEVKFSSAFAHAVFNKYLHFRYRDENYEARMTCYFPDYKVQYAN